MKTPSPPPAPDPKVTAQTQSAGNISTATAQQTLNLIDKFGPDGSETYKINEYVEQPDGFGGTVKVPRYTQTTTLSDENKRIYDIGKETETNIATIGRDQSRRIGDLLGQPVNLTNESVESRLFDLGKRRLDPEFARNEEAERTRLANSGIREGSAAYNSAMERLSQSKNDAYNQLALSGRSQSVQEILAERNQPINEITALLSGSQVGTPQFASTPQTGVAGVDYSGIVRDKYNADMAAYNSKVSSNNAMLGGLFGLAAAPFSMFKFSDRRLKTDVSRVGKLDNGLPVYAYRYKGDATPQIGVMAQDVEKKNPSAVHEIGGFKAVDYSEAVR